MGALDHIFGENLMAIDHEMLEAAISVKEIARASYQNEGPHTDFYWTVIKALVQEATKDYQEP
jgi:hypothetical protein